MVMHMLQNFYKEKRGVESVFSTIRRRNGNEGIQWSKILPLDLQSIPRIAKSAKSLARTLDENKKNLTKQSS